MTLRSIHERIGWFNCANLDCRKEVGQDHVTVTTTAHMYRFCCMECVGEGLEAWRQHTYRALAEAPDTDYEGDLDEQRERDMQYVYYSSIAPPAAPG